MGGDRRGAVPPVVRGALRAAAGPQEGDEAERGRGGPHQQEALQEDREEVQGEAKGGKGRAGSGGSVPDWARPRLHLLAPRPVRPRRRVRPRGKGARVLPQEDQGQEGTLRGTMMDARKDYVAERL